MSDVEIQLFLVPLKRFQHSGIKYKDNSLFIGFKINDFLYSHWILNFHKYINSFIVIMIFYWLPFLEFFHPLCSDFFNLVFFILCEFKLFCWFHVKWFKPLQSHWSDWTKISLHSSHTHYLDLSFLFTGQMTKSVFWSSESLGILSIWVSSKCPCWQLSDIQAVLHSRCRWFQSQVSSKCTLHPLKGPTLFKAVSSIWLLI